MLPHTTPLFLQKKLHLEEIPPEKIPVRENLTEIRIQYRKNVVIFPDQVMW
jgi:hypothetical protein